MNSFEVICLIIAGISLMCCIFSIVIYKKKMKRTLNNVSNMIDSAINGYFEETTFDESQVSAIESKLFRYLKANSSINTSINEEKDKIKALISDISHQTKTPISNILLYSELLKEQENLSSETIYMIDNIAEQSEKLNFLISSLITTSRLETGIVSVNPSKNSIKELIEKLLPQFKLEINKKDIKLKVDFIDCVANFDMKWTSEALLNILDNAIKYTPMGGSINIRIKRYELFSCIEITDDGIGISEEDYSRIFTRFYRGKTVSQYSGVGIGLYLTREILKKEGGYVTVDSKINEGSTFAVYLPN